MTQEKKKSLLLLLVSTLAFILVLGVCIFTIANSKPNEGMGIILLILVLVAMFIATPAAIADIKFLLKKDDNKKD
jgi:hypothetical protein